MYIYVNHDMYIHSILDIRYNRKVRLSETIYFVFESHVNTDVCQLEADLVFFALPL